MPCEPVSTLPKGGSCVTDVAFLSPTRLATYATCQRQFYYDYERDVDAPDRTELYLNQGSAYHETIEDVCEATDRDDEPAEIYRRALDAFETRWNEHVDSDEYASRAHQAYQRAENRAAIEALFDPDGGEGIAHARQSIATEEWVRSVHDGIGLWGKVDNVLRTEEGLHCIDYKRNLRGVLSANTAEQLVDHLDALEHAGQKLKNAFQTATYVEGVKASEYYEAGMDVRFSFYGLLNQTDHTRTSDGYEISVRGYPRETTEIYEEYYDPIWKLIRNSHEGITGEMFEPAPFELIEEEACPDCRFSEMCPDRLATEVRR